MRIQNFTLFMGFALLASCGGTTSGGSDDPSNTNTPDQEVNSGQSFTVDGDNYSAEVNGITFQSSTIYLDDVSGQPILRQNVIGDERQAYIAIDGDYVAGFAGSYSNGAGNNESFAFYGLDGTLSVSQLSGNVQYNGVYMTADSTNANGANYIYEAVIMINFDTGEIIGRTLDNGAPDSNVVFNGVLDGNSINLTINDQYGEHQAEGGLYGPDSEELAAGYEDDEIAGLLYGQN